MRSRFALLIATAVVFAAGWYGQEAPQHPRGSDLVARVLTPTGDEGAMREAAADPKPQLSSRQGNRWRPNFTFVAIVAFGLGATALSFYWAIACHREPPPPPHRVRYRFSRAPPHLQPA